MSRFHAVLIFFLSLFLFSTPAYAQLNNSEGWPVKQKCVSHAKPMPSDAMFEGTIIATGWAGIHGIRADRELPYVLAFRDKWIQDFLSYRRALSPDGTLLAFPRGTERYSCVTTDLNDICNGYVDVSEIAIYDLTNRGQVQYVPLVLNYQYRPLMTAFWVSQSRTTTPQWDSNESIIFMRQGQSDRAWAPWRMPKEIVRINWPAGTIDTIDTTVPYLLQPLLAFPSPDWSQVVVTPDIDDPTLLFESLADDPIELFDSGSTVSIIAWHPESTRFLLSHPETIRLYHQDGTLIDTIANMPEEPESYMMANEHAYSPGGDKFWLRLNATSVPNISRGFLQISPPATSTLGISNAADETLIDTCIELKFATVQFSPDGRYLALLDRNHSEIRIFDTATWNLYTTGIFHDGEIIGWRNQ